MSNYVPKRRKRKMHIGLFGYSRENQGIKLPRAIKFAASLYSLGLPPELLGLSSLSEKNWEFIEENTGIEQDFLDALKYYNKDNLGILPEDVQEDIKVVAKRFDYDTDKKHKKVTGFIYNDFKKNNLMGLSENIERAASLRNFLG